MQRYLSLMVAGLVTLCPLEGFAADALPLRDFGCFSLWIPPGFTVEKQEGPDFYVYRIGPRDRQYVAIYQGCCPNFPFPAGEEGLEETVLSTPFVTIISRWRGNVLAEREMLIDKPQIATRLHVWSKIPEASEMAIGDKIMLSLDFKPSCF